jgi:hypothetical protein
MSGAEGGGRLPFGVPRDGHSRPDSRVHSGSLMGPLGGADWIARVARTPLGAICLHHFLGLCGGWKVDAA